MTTRRGIPTYEQPMSTEGNMSQSWRRWFHDIEVGTPPSNEVTIIPTGSPFTYQATARGYVIVNGSVTEVDFSRTSGTFYNTGQTKGMFSVSLGDFLKVTYTGSPTMVFVPS